MRVNARSRPIPWVSQTKDGQVLLSESWEMFVLGVSILSIANLFLLVFIRNPDVEQIVFIMDTALIVIFAVDFLRRLRVAKDDNAYIVHGYGWLDLISIIPMLRIARLLRIARVTRIVIRMGGPGQAVRAFFRSKAAGGFLLVLFIALLVMEFGSILILWAERGAPDANIVDAEDAFWYVLVTMSTVGYGDQVPVCELGRLVGALIIIFGVGVFGTSTGFLTYAFLSPSEDRDEAPNPDGADRNAVAGALDPATDAERG